MVDAAHIEIGKLGEQVAEKYLKNNDFIVLDRNYRRGWGEIDLIANRHEIVHFVEVKTVSYGTTTELKQAHTSGSWRPEEMVHAAKQEKLARIIETWCLDKHYAGGIQLDVLAIRLVVMKKYATVEYFPNITET